MLNAQFTVGALIAARTNASRLPGKVLLTVQEKPLIEHQIERVRRASLLDLIVLCTTTLAADNQLAMLGEKMGIEVFRGSPSDVPYRLLQAAEIHRLDFIVLIEGDEAFVDWTYIDALITRAHTTGADYVKTQGLPIGAWVCGMRTSALRTLCNEVCTEGLDGWGAFFENQPSFYTERVEAAPKTTAISQQLRLTIDYPEDFQLLEAIYNRLYRHDHIFSLEDVLQLFHREPQLANINQHLIDTYWERLKQQTLGRHP